MLRAYIFIVSLLLYSFSIFGSVKEEYYLQGNIGGKEIALTFEDYSNLKNPGNATINGSYFYFSKLRDVAFTGVVFRGSYILYVKESYGSFQEKIVLKKEKDQSFTGTWQSGKTTVSVKLYPIQVNKIVHPHAQLSSIAKLKKGNAYEYLKSSKLNFVVDKIVSIRKHDIEIIKEQFSKIDFFQIQKGEPKVNEVLLELHLRDALDNLSITDEKVGEQSDNYGFRIGYSDKSLIGFSLNNTPHFEEEYYGDLEDEGYLLDINTGKMYNINDIISFDDQFTEYTDKGWKQSYKYRKSYFAPKIYEILNTQYNFKKPTPKEIETGVCDYTQLDIWMYPNWSFTTQGIEFTPTSNEEMNCERSFLLSFEQLEMYKNRNYPYRFPR